MVSILINGACGKMGRMLTETAAQHGVSVAAMRRALKRIILYMKSWRTALKPQT